MSEEATTPAAATEPSEQEAPKQPKPTETVDFWKQKAREQEQRAKANAEAATRLEQIENASKTETQKLTDRADTAEQRATRAEADLLKVTVAWEKGLTPAQAKRLVGETREELEADADDLLTTFKPATDEQQPVAPSLDLGTPSGAPMPLNGDPLERALRSKLGIT